MPRPESRDERIRIGPLSLITLITILSLAVLSVLAVTTANAASVMTQRQETSTAELYHNEVAAQTFMASLDNNLATVRSGSSSQSAASMAQSVLQQACADGMGATQGVTATATMEGNTLTAQFSGAAGRTLGVKATIEEDGTYTVVEWKMTGIQNEEPTDTLWTGA